MKYLKLLILLALVTNCTTEPDAKWIQTEEQFCINGECTEETFTCWKNLVTGYINCDPEFTPEGY
jgi:hypothetical protein